MVLNPPTIPASTDPIATAKIPCDMRTAESLSYPHCPTISYIAIEPMPAGIKTNNNTMTNSGHTENPKGNHRRPTSTGPPDTTRKATGRRVQYHTVPDTKP